MVKGVRGRGWVEVKITGRGLVREPKPQAWKEHLHVYCITTNSDWSQGKKCNREPGAQMTGKCGGMIQTSAENKAVERPI